ncbi:unnamed protein product [Moneuplotes crassus]|uniref:Uncharacterized protein n=1 Tax=Euplotes crassus TaxID=5936 RepID=A0AAD2D8E7_EUPCR|nr:unnamed protein product [Moneuplotes crassus]
MNSKTSRCPTWLTSIPKEPKSISRNSRNSSVNCRKSKFRMRENQHDNLRGYAIKVCIYTPGFA